MDHGALPIALEGLITVLNAVLITTQLANINGG